MMHYRKGENVEKPLTKDDLPFEDFLPKGSDFLWMHVNGGTKVNNVVTYAKNALDKGEHKNIVWSGHGGGVVKTISCAEIIKRSYPLYQVTRMCYTSVEEHWKPQMEGLEEIVAHRQIPSLHIYMSLEPIDDNVAGLQKPNSKTDFWIYDANSSNNQQSNGGNSQNSRRNQRPRKDGNQEQRRPQRPRQQQTQQSTNNNNDEQTNNDDATNVNNPSGSQPNKSSNSSKRRRPYPQQNRGPRQQNQNSNANNNKSADAGQAMES
ncbi:ribonuclease P protein subunit p25-like protein [Musca domestica]|uniref:Ribonuclease P protein subunit p25-like protein n=1 Tax=Musca domestica TaxID=7370 RepID=A0A1I8N9H2_MUSDO|nr:ribonuclease P protein subunit p25-like protein [Musca domestica]XP_058981807.1 ribonuclease P protein subunit p25-like protein [Musca domestica]